LDMAAVVSFAGQFGSSGASSKRWTVVRSAGGNLTSFDSVCLKIWHQKTNCGAAMNDIVSTQLDC
jgi:hypothetical protein